MQGDIFLESRYESLFNSNKPSVKGLRTYTAGPLVCSPQYTACQVITNLKQPFI